MKTNGHKPVVPRQELLSGEESPQLPATTSRMELATSPQQSLLQQQQLMAAMPDMAFITNTLQQMVIQSAPILAKAEQGQEGQYARVQVSWKKTTEESQS
jgi:hypothetical protein